MIVTDPRSLGLLVRQRRREIGWSQSRLAEAAEVSRPWISELESGKSTAELGLVFSVFQALGLQLNAAGAPERSRRIIGTQHLASGRRARAKDKGSDAQSGGPVRTEVRGRPGITRAGKSIAIARARSSFTFQTPDKSPAKTRSE